MTEFTETEKNIIKYWITACEDFERPKECKRSCLIYEPCLKVRKKLWGDDVLRHTEYEMRIDPDEE